MLGEKVVGDHQGELLLRRAGRRGEGQVQDHPHARPTSGGIPPPAGTGSSARATGGSPPIPRGIPAGRAGACSGPWPAWWGRHQAPPEVVAEAERADPARRDARRRDRHRAGQGGPPRPGPALRDHGRDHRPVAPHDRRHGDRAGRAQAVPRLYLGRSRPLPRGRHDRGGRPRADPRPQAGRRQGDAQAAQDHLRRRAPAGRDARRELGPRRSTPRAGPPGDQGVGPGPVPARGDDRRRQGARRSKGATCSRSPGKDSTARASASTTWRSSPSGRSTGPARRSGS